MQCKQPGNGCLTRATLTGSGAHRSERQAVSGLCIILLLVCNRPVMRVTVSPRHAITKAVNWYKANREGGVDLTDAYLTMLFYSGRNAGDIAVTMAALKGLQSSNGGWVEGRVSSTPLEDPRFTAQAVISLYRHSATGGGANIRKALQWLKTMMVEPAGDFQYPYDQARATSLALLALHNVNNHGEYNEVMGEALVRCVNTQKSNGNWNPQLSMTATIFLKRVQQFSGGLVKQSLLSPAKVVLYQKR